MYLRVTSPLRYPLRTDKCTGPETTAVSGQADPTDRLLIARSLNTAESGPSPPLVAPRREKKKKEEEEKEGRREEGVGDWCKGHRQSGISTAGKPCTAPRRMREFAGPDQPTTDHPG